MVLRAFKREIGKNTLYVDTSDPKKPIITLKEKVLPAKPFKHVKSDSILTPNNVFMTIDIETILIDNIQTPYLICGYGKDIQIESRTDNTSIESQDKMFKEFITKLIDVKKKNKHLKYVYAHNFAGFDGILFMKHLINYEGANVKPLIFNNKLMSIKFEFKCEGHKNSSTLTFKDSYLMLPYGLRALCKAFKVNNPKTYFPYLLSILNYIGEYPEYKYFTKITESLYNSNKESFRGLWSFREESLKYCRIDCIALFEVIEKFNELIFNTFKKNVHSSLTLSALAMSIYKSLYMPKDTLYQMLGATEKDIREAYTGGRVDVFRSHNSETPQPSDNNIELYYYDVNSLYPFIMSTLDMPTGKPIAFNGNILRYEPDAKGFFYCEIDADDKLICPTLQRRIKTKDGVRTIAGTGKWKGWIHYDEYHECIGKGYDIEIIKGYKFKYTNIFKDYVETLYNLRLQYSKDDPMNLIAKMLMNSLYGKFGMKSETNKVDIFDTGDSGDMDLLNTILDCDAESIQDQIEIGKHIIIVRKNMSACKYDAKEDVYHGLDVNVAIAAAITAGGRMYMSQFMFTGYRDYPGVIDNYPIWYTDTDSIITSIPLLPIFIGSELGKFKLEHVITKAIFIAPKVYGLVTNENKTILKVKGLSHQSASNISVNELGMLLISKASMTIENLRTSRNMYTGKVGVLNSSYNLMSSSSKRVPIYEEVGNLSSGEPVSFLKYTRAYNYDDVIVKDK